MTHTDQELLILAARAARKDLTGYTWEDGPFYTGFMRRNFEPCGLELQAQCWNPLDDSTEALELLVTVKIDIAHAAWGDACVGRGGVPWSRFGMSDNPADYRRAIVLAAVAYEESKHDHTS